MSYQPQVGDRVRRKSWLFGHIEVQFVGVGVLVGTDEHGSERVGYIDGREDWVKVEPRPKVREQNIGLKSDGYATFLQSNARIVTKTVRLLGTADGHWSTVAVVTDLDGNPLEVQT